jgi:hypothetical protein
VVTEIMAYGPLPGDADVALHERGEPVARQGECLQVRVG